MSTFRPSGQVEIWRYRLAIGTDGKQFPVHVADEETARAGFMQHGHDAGSQVLPRLGSTTS
jgi:hypothetical protein